LLTRFYDPTGGTVTFDGTGKCLDIGQPALRADRADIREFTPESWRNRIGVVFQDPILFAGTVHDNIAYGSPDASRRDVEEAARQANCDFIWDLPQGFDTKSELGSSEKCDKADRQLEKLV
jgi:ABC-type multidrug transport system fused ATPase/permease subunit